MTAQTAKPSVKPSVAPMIAVTPAKPSVQAVAPAAQMRPKAPRPLIGEERRRSQRVLLRTRAQIHVALEGKLTTIKAFTLSVNPQGALVVMAQSLPVDARLVLEHGTTKKCVPCKVVREARQMPEGFHVPIEFDSPAPEFWGIAFPPLDWRADDEQNP